MNTMSKTLLSAAVSLVLFGCSSQGTIGDLQSSNVESEGSLNFDNLDHEQVRNEYKELIDLVDDAYLKEQIERRIAGVSMLEGDDKQAKGAKKPKKGYYRDAIASYVDILEKYPNSPDNAEVLYQLAKAYDMEGQSRNARQMLERLISYHPYYSGIAEVYFRLGDIYFNAGLYEKSEHAYRQTTLKDGGKLLLNAHYMQAWSLYKLGNYNAALEHFAFVLNDLLQAEQAGRKLNNIEKPLIKDALHSMSLALVNLGGAKAIADIKSLQGKNYQWRLFAELADFYLEKSRYDDSAATYREFIANHPMDERASDFQSKLIASYVKGGFPKLVLAEKETYVALYQPTGKYFTAHESKQASIKKALNDYYVELAAHYHSQGQIAAKQAKAPNAETHLAELSKKSFIKANQFYGDFIENFASDKRRVELQYKKADAQFENQLFAASASDYVEVAYAFGNHKYANKAAYASIIAYQKHIDGLVAEHKKPNEKQLLEQDKWRGIAVENMLKFAKVFHTDERSIAVLTNAAQSMFALNQYERAITVASDLINGNKSLNKNLRKTALGILAHSYFQLGQYQLAQNNYDAQRKLLVKDSQEYLEISDQLAVTVFKKAEAFKVAKQNQLAINELLSIKTLAPKAKVRVMAQYDAVSLMLADKQWKNAIAQLQQLQGQFAKHELAKEFPRKLAFAYEQDKQFAKAANAYEGLYKNDQDPKVRQEALFVAAGLFEKLKNNDKALEYYKEYARAYEKPFDNRMEARYHIADLYAQANDASRELYWLRRVIDGHDKAGKLQTERSKWLAAWANAKYGDYFAGEFNKRRLSLPLEKSMAKKNQHLQDATQRYEMAAAYGILEFLSMSRFKIADLYDTFSAELQRAPLPKGLSTSDEQMYRDIINQQAQPFAQLATSIHQSNTELSWQGHYNEWIENSFTAMKRLAPLRYNKVEDVARYGDEIR